MITVKHKGNFKNTEKFFTLAQRLKARSILERYGLEGVSALRLATPIDTGLTANSWEYNIKITRNGCNISWNNTNVNDGVPIAILIQYGHASRNGRYIQGFDYINPAIRPIFDKIADILWEEVCNI